MNPNPEYSLRRSFYPGRLVSGSLAANIHNALPESATKIIPLPLTLPGDGVALTNLFAGQLDEIPIMFEDFLDTVIGDPNGG